MKPMSYKETISRPTNCRVVREILDTAEPNAQQLPEVASHCEQCPACRHYELELTGLRSLLAAQPRVEAPPNFDLKLRQRIAASREKKEPALLWWSIVWQSTGAFAALVVVGLLVGVIYFQYIQKPTHTVATPSVATNATARQTPVRPDIPVQVKPDSVDGPTEKIAKTDENPSTAEPVSEPVRRGGRGFEPSSRTLATSVSLNSPVAVTETDEILITLHDEANQTRTQSVKRVIFGAQPIVNLGEVVDTDDLESSSLSKESTIF